MSDKIKIVRVFIGSPSGLDNERQAAREVVHEVNLSNSEYWGCQFKLVGWEDTIPGYQRPQDKINEDLDKCDYFLGVLWNWWGSKPSTDESDYTSGFHEEFCRAKQHIDSGRMKDLAIYFKSVEVPKGMEPGEHIKKVLDFRQNCIDEKLVFFKDFDSLESFRDHVRNKLVEIGWRETEIRQSEGREKSQSEQAPRPSEQSEGTDTQNSSLIDEEAREFLSEISQRPLEWEETKPHEIARFRLIASTLSRSGNDVLYLGNHDANLVFKHLRNSPVSEQEIQTLIDCGVVGFPHQNVPIWRWIAKAEQDGDFFGRVRVLAAIGNEQEKKNAIQILGLASQPIPSLNDFFDKKKILTSWLSDQTENQTFEAVISFLSANAESDDISLIEEVLSDFSPQRCAKIEAAIVGVLSRSNIDTALKRLVEKKVDKIEDRLVAEIFRSPQSLVTETIVLCLSAKSDGVRLRAVQILFEREEISLEAAETLLTDSNHEIRLLAAESLKKLGRELDPDLVRKALTIEKQPSAFDFGLFKRKETDATYYERYLSNRLGELDFPALKVKVAEAGTFDDRELSVLYSKFRSKMQDEIRENLKDCFKSHFDTAIQIEEDSGRMKPDMVSRIRKLEIPHRKELCMHALTALCGMAKAQDLHLVRKTLDEIEVDAMEITLKYLARFGDWSDIDRIKKQGDYPSDRTGLLSIHRTELPEQKAGAILALGKIRIADMLALDLDGSIRRSLAKQLPKQVFVDLSDDILMRELNRDDNEYRIIFALRCVQSLSKSRVTSLLNQYVDGEEQQYYNCVNWLDLGASLPIRLAKSITKRALLRY